MFKLRNHFINTTSMFLAPPNEGEEDTRTDAQKERDAIEISSSTDENKDDKNSSENEEANEEDDDNDDEDENEEDDEEENDEKDEVEEKKEETAEEKTARLAAEKEERKQARIQRKFDKIAAEKTAAENRVKELEKQLGEKTVEGLTEEEVERRAEAIAATKLTEKQLKDAKKAFEDNCDKLEEAAIKSDKNFPRAINELTTELGPIPSVIINTLTELDNDNGGEVLAYLANNVDEAEDLYELKGNERKLTIKLTRISDKLKEAKKAPKKERSNVPAPITPIGEGNRRESTSTNVTGKESMEDFVAKRNAADAKRREARGY